MNILKEFFEDLIEGQKLAIKLNEEYEAKLKEEKKDEPATNR